MFLSEKKGYRIYSDRQFRPIVIFQFQFKQKTEFDLSCDEEIIDKRELKQKSAV